ncbi:MAG: hypothetical protein OXC79_00635 [Candidatus Poribacteria bacterium]|nr:hypothetical protein [Candidatus Poribacteria bacterium]
MKEAVVEQEVKTYFTDRFPQFSVSQQCEIRFGTRKGGIADVVLHQPVDGENGYFVAIAECKTRPLPVNRFFARAQLKSYLSATNTRYGLLAIGTDPRDWEFCENKSNNWFALIEQADFEAGIDNWKPVSVDSLTVSLQREQKTTRWWKQVALSLFVAFLISCASIVLLWQKPPPESVVYITRTGKKYHTYDCSFLEQYADRKFAILLDKAEKDYNPCGICNPKP